MKKTLSLKTLAIVAAFATAPLLAGASGWATAPPIPITSDVAYKNGRLSVRAVEADPKLILGKVALALGGSLEIAGDVPGDSSAPVTLEFTRVRDLHFWVNRLAALAWGNDVVVDFIWLGFEPNKLVKMSVARRRANLQAAGGNDSRQREFRSHERVNAWLKETYPTAQANSYFIYRTGQGGRLSGAYIRFPEMAPPATPEDARGLAEMILSRFTEVLEVPRESLQYSHTEIVDRAFRVHYQHTIDSIPVLWSNVLVILSRDEPNINVSSHLKYDIDVRTKPMVPPQQAARIAISECRGQVDVDHWRGNHLQERVTLLEAPPRLVIYEYRRSRYFPDEPLIFRLAWEVQVMDDSYMIDATEGYLINFYDIFFPPVIVDPPLEHR